MPRDRHQAIREDVIESIERSAEVYGLSRSAGRVFGVLYFSDDPLSIPELVDQTGYAKSTISNATRKLSRIGMIRRRSSAGGGRRVRFTPETDFWLIIQDVFRQYVHREMEITQRSLERALTELEGIQSEEAQADRERVTSLAEMYGEIQTLIDFTLDHSPEEMIAAIEQYDKNK